MHVGKLREAMFHAVAEQNLFQQAQTQDIVRAMQIDTICSVGIEISRNSNIDINSALQKSVDLYFQLEQTLRASEESEE
jgi:hypothetical protein